MNTLTSLPSNYDSSLWHPTSLCLFRPPPSPLSSPSPQPPPPLPLGEDARPAYRIFMLTTVRWIWWRHHITFWWLIAFMQGCPFGLSSSGSCSEPGNMLSTPKCAAGTCENDDSSKWHWWLIHTFFINRGHWRGAPTPHKHNGGVGSTPIKSCHRYADVRLHIFRWLRYRLHRLRQLRPNKVGLEPGWMYVATKQNTVE